MTWVETGGMERNSWSQSGAPLAASVLVGVGFALRPSSPPPRPILGIERWRVPSYRGSVDVAAWTTYEPFQLVLCSHFLG